MGETVRELEKKVAPMYNKKKFTADKTGNWCEKVIQELETNLVEILERRDKITKKDWTKLLQNHKDIKYPNSCIKN